MPRQDFYADALLYDILHQEGTSHDARVMARIVRAHGPARPRGTPLTLLEPACGSGRYLVALANAGHRAAGFDLSPAMVRHAQASARAAGVGGGVRAFTARMESFALPPAWRAHGAFNLINSIRHLETDAAMLAHLRCMEQALLPGGVYVVGLGLCAYGIETESEDVWTGSRVVGGVRTRVTQTVQYLPAPEAGRNSGRKALRMERVISHMTVRRGTGARATERHIDSAYVLRSYDMAQWRAIVGRAGWEIAAVTDQDGLAARPSEPGYYLWVLRAKQRRA
ncbi:MAG TPA: class I SAM-dependent methyltransferase [Phycisphaerales bacterium]|nr:class I SAM-dependent methyltransferase [Phycisphaerales bacterium]